MNSTGKKTVLELNPHAEVLFVHASPEVHTAHMEGLAAWEKDLLGDPEEYASDFGDWEGKGGAKILAELSSAPPDVLTPTKPVSHEGLLAKVGKKIKGALGKISMSPHSLLEDNEARDTGRTTGVVPQEVEVQEDNPFDLNDGYENAFSCTDWLDGHVTYDKDGLPQWDGEVVDPGNRQEMLQYLLIQTEAREAGGGNGTVDEHNLATAWLTLARQVCGYSHEGNDLAEAIINHDDTAWFAVSYPEHFPDFKFDMQWVDSMLSKEKYEIVLRCMNRLDESIDIQSLMATILDSENGCDAAIYCAAYLPDTIRLPEGLILETLRTNPYKIIDLLRTNKLQYIDASLLLEECAEELGPHICGELLDAMRGRRLELVQIERLMDEGQLEARIVLRCHEGIVGLETVEQVRAFMLKYRAVPSISRANEYDTVIQSAIFWSLIESFRGNISIYDLVNFTRLGDQECMYILDRHHDTIWRGTAVDGGYLRRLEELFGNASEAVQQRYEETLGIRLRARDAEYQQLSDETNVANERRTQQRSAELSYFEADNIVVDTLDRHAQPSDEEIWQQFEREHCVKAAPILEEQAAQQTRTNEITYLELAHTVGTHTDNDTYLYDHRHTTEHEALATYVSMLKSVNARRSQAQDMIDNLTFIGEAEYAEAVRGIATYWKHLLDSQPDLQLFVLKGAISSKGRVKSDEYMFDRIVSHFSDEELARYKNRLIIRDSDIAQDNPEHLRVVLLDDWTISGSQLRYAAHEFLKQHPDSQACMEVCLIAASKERIALGLEEIRGIQKGYSVEADISLPLKAYFMAHHARYTDSSARGVHITGAHSAVDYGFEEELDRIYGGSGKTMPPLANIVRPYRQTGYRRESTARIMRLYDMDEDEA